VLLLVFAHISDYRTVCRVSHISCYIESFLFSCLNTNSSSVWTACRISHTPWIWLTVSFVLPNHKQFIRVNRMLYISHTFIWLPVSFVRPHRKQLSRLNRMPCIAHATKTWTMFDASIIANVLYISDGFHTPPFAIIAWHTVSRRVLDRSVALAASYSSVGFPFALKIGLVEVFSFMMAMHHMVVFQVWEEKDTGTGHWSDHIFHLFYIYFILHLVLYSTLVATTSGWSMFC